jgi:outer membrane protein assembly factor BamC
MAKKDGGIFSRLFGSDSQVKAEQYRVQVSGQTSGSQVLVLNKDGAAENSKTTQRILSLLHEQLK